MKRATTRVLGVIALLATALPPAAASAALISIEASTRAAYNGGDGGALDGSEVDELDTSATSGTLTVSDSRAAGGDFGRSTLQLDAHAAPGRLRGRIDASSRLFSPFDTQVNTDTAGLAVLSWQDEFTIVSSTLAPGTPVDIVARLLFEGDVDLAGFEQPPREVFAGLGSPGGGILFDFTGAGAFSLFDERIFSMNVGDTFSMNGFLQLDGLTVAFHSFDPLTGGLEPISDLLINAFNSAVTGIEVLNPDASLSTASGASYLTNPRIGGVPEPGSLILMGLGLFAAMSGARRRRQPVR